MLENDQALVGRLQNELRFTQKVHRRVRNSSILGKMPITMRRARSTSR